MKRVFISYSKHDHEAAKFLAEWLDARKVDAFIDYQKLIGGENFTDKLAKELESSDLIVFVVSENSIKSRWVKLEIEHAHRYAKRIIPLRLDETEYTSGLNFLIGNIQYIDFTSWHSDRQLDESLRKLAVSLEIEVVAPSKEFPLLKKITLENIESLQELQIIREARAYPTSVAFSPTGSLLAAGFGDVLIKQERSKGFVKIWRPLTGELITDYRGHSADVQGVVFSLIGDKVASFSLDGTIRNWDISGKPSRIYSQKDPVTGIAFAKIDQFLFSSLANGAVLKWDLKTRVYETIFQFDGAVENIAFSKGGLLAIAWKEMIIIWDYYLNSEIVRYNAHDAKVRDLDFSPDEALLASGSDDRTIRLWNTSTWKEETVLPGHHDRVRTVAFSPDGQLLASGSNDSTIRLWNVKNHSQVGTLTSHLDTIFSAQFSSNGMLLASCSFDRTIRVWGIRQ